ncbi:unnamed protein product [Rhizophagus irregularis]|nr:unnamed protein product [Rhizophagus irregularis]
MEFLTKNFANWTSGNKIIDNFIQEKQSSYSEGIFGNYGVVFEWIPYDKFIDIEKIEESDFATTIWKDGSLSYNKDEEEWIRTSHEKVILRFLSNSENITDEFINKIKSYLLDSYYSNYGISQNPDTRDYILVFRNEYFNCYCKRCGEQYERIRDDYENFDRYNIDKYNKWCKSCHVNYLKNNFTNWTSGNEIIDNFIQMKQLNIKTSYDLIFDWIPYNELVEIKEIGKDGFYVAIWKEGSLHYDVVEKEWIKKPKKVVLKYLSDLQNITDESLNEAFASIDGYGISQNPNTKDYILVIHNKYYNKYCKECDKEYIKLNHKCCESCLIKYLGSNLINWTSGHEKIDDFIRKRQLKTSIESSNIFEWIPYNKFIEIKKVEDNCLTTAIWKKGPLIYNTYEKKWMRTLSKKVFLKYFSYSQNVTDEFINKIESYLTNNMDYGVSQNPDTRDYILVFNSEYFDYYCEKCGNKYEKCDNKYKKWCRLCQINHLKDNFTNWTSGIEKIDSLIQKNQLKIYEWLFTAKWKDGPLYYSISNKKYKRKLNEEVLLKYLYGSQNINNKFLNEIIYLIEKSYGISQDPNTNDFILVLQFKYYCKNCGKKYNNQFEIDNKSCISCQTNCKNKKINDLIQEMKLNVDYFYSNVIFEWIPYDQFNDIKEIGKGGFSTVYSAIWKNGLLDSINKIRIPNTKVALKYLNNSQNFVDEFINEVKAYSNSRMDNILNIY